MWKEDSHVIAHALGMWANYMETGQVTMGAQDAQKCGRESVINRLDSGQVDLVKRLRALAKHHLVAGSTAAPATATETAKPLALSGSWRVENGIDTCRVGRVKVAQITSIQGDSDAYLAQGMMPGIPTDLGCHDALDQAREYVDRAVTAWLAALQGEA